VIMLLDIERGRPTPIGGKMVAEISELESEVMRMLLNGNDPVLNTLREQWRASRVEKRELTGVGFYTRFSVLDSIPRIEGNRTFNFGDVIAEINGLQYGAGFVLFVKDGVINMLEGYTYDESWPPIISAFRLAYNQGAERDWGALRKKWL
jgi:hypothetical protein